jgi:hypothetical protein
LKHPFPQLEFPSAEALQDIESLTTATQEVYDWIMTNIVGNDVLPRRCPAEVAEPLGKLHGLSERLKSKIDHLRNEETSIFMEMLKKAQRKEMLNPTEYYYLRSLDLISGVDDEHSEYRRYQLAFESKNAPAAESLKAASSD